MDDEMLPALVEVVPAPLVMVDASCRFRDVNPAAYELFGRRREDLLGADLVDTFVRGDRDDVRLGAPRDALKAIEARA